MATNANVARLVARRAAAVADGVPELVQRLAGGEADATARHRGAAQHDPGEADADRDSGEPDERRHPPAVEAEPVGDAPDRRGERDQQPGEHERRHADLARVHDLDETLRVEARRAEELQLDRVVERLHLAHPVEVAHRRDDVLHVGHDQVAGDELDHPAHDVLGRPQQARRARPVEAVSPQALERLDHAAMVGREPLGPRERRPARKLGQHLPLAR